MKITGTNKTITFDFENGYVLNGTGEILGNATFAVDTDSLNKWDPPHEDEEVTKEDIDYLMEYVKSITNEDTVQLYFD